MISIFVRFLASFMADLPEPVIESIAFALMRTASEAALFATMSVSSKKSNSSNLLYG